MAFLNCNAQHDSYIGTWNLEIQKDGEVLPSWLEIYKSGHSTLVGRFVYAFGSARPIAEVEQRDGEIYFSIPRQWEPEGENMKFSASLENGTLSGIMIYTDGTEHMWKGQRAPVLMPEENVKFGDEIQLFDGKSLEGWKVLGQNQWAVEGGILKNKKAGGNLVSEENFENFKLMVEFKYPKGSNSGIYLRGRYEVQIEDSYGKSPSNILFGAVYGFLTPNTNMARMEGQWQSYEITLNGRLVTIVANGKPIIIEQNIPGITGGALDNHEEKPGPILIQGDHGPIEFRKISIVPIVKSN